MMWVALVTSVALLALPFQLFTAVSAEPNILHRSDMKCSEADFSALPFFRGTDCHTANIWPGRPCPLKGSCVPACSRCLVWRRGELPLAQAAAAADAAAAEADLVDPIPQSLDHHERSNPTFTPNGADGAAATHRQRHRCDSTLWSLGSWVRPDEPLQRAAEGGDPKPLPRTSKAARRRKPPPRPPRQSPSSAASPTTAPLLELWQPSLEYAAQCPRRRGPLSPGSIYRCLRGRRVVLAGDSMIRPLLGRLVAHLRGLEQYVDHSFHAPGGYYMANGTHDAFVEGAILPSLLAAEAAAQENAAFWAAGQQQVPTGAGGNMEAVSATVQQQQETPPTTAPPAVPEASWDPTATLELQFYWAPFFHRHNETQIGASPVLQEHLGILYGGTDVLIAGPMYHEINSTYDTHRTALLSLFKEIQSHTGMRLPYFFWVASLPGPGHPADQFAVRNHRMRAFVQMLNDRSLYGDDAVPQHSFFVDAERMAALLGRERASGLHYQCVKRRSFPYPITRNADGLDKRGKDCRDPLNLNLILTILRVVCEL